MDNTKTMIIVAAITFFLGLLIGFPGSGNDMKEISIKELLQKAAGEIDTLEKEKEKLQGELKTDNEDLTKEIKSLKEQLYKVEQEKDAIKKDAFELKAQLAHTETKLQSNEAANKLRSRVAELEKENSELIMVMSKINSMIRPEPAQVPEKAEAEQPLKQPEIKSILETTHDEPQSEELKPAN